MNRINLPERLRRGTLGLMLLAIIPLSMYAAAAQANPSTYTLGNGKVRAKFNENGLESIYSYRLQKEQRFIKDGFSLVVDGNEVTEGGLTRRGISRGHGELVYRFESPELKIRVVYNLRAGWDFVGKQLFVMSKTAHDIEVGKVCVLDERIARPITDEYVIKSRYRRMGTKDYGVFLRFADHTGLFALVQNPFLDYHRDGQNFFLTYDAGMNWKPSFGTFRSDIGCMGIYALRGPKIPVHMIPEWQWTGGKNPDVKQYEYRSEVKAFTGCVDSFVLDKMPRPLNVQVGWTENDYQIDVSMKSGRDVYRRIIKRASALGLEYILFQPTNSLLGNYLEASDSWHVENRLWLGLGIEIRKNEWNPVSSPMPQSIQTMLNYARSKRMKLIAYVYPILPFQQNKSWLVTVGKGKGARQYASLGNHEFQDWLINELEAFKKRTGIGGYSFDYTFLTLPGYSIYAQWWGWRRVMESLRKRFPDIVMDGRQAYQEYGPWSWLAGSYPHPTSMDEQPESFVPFPDLHFDRVSADRERYTAYRYRIREYCPQVLMPGFIGHQTDRFNDRGQHIREPFRIRDWDYLGWKYSLISSIGYAGLNNVVNMIPARDPEEYRDFPKKDIEFFRSWLEWTKTNEKYLAQTMSILGQPAVGKVDGTSAIINDKGFVFLYNPNGRAMTARFTLDEAIGLKRKGPYILEEIYPEKGKYIGKTGSGFWKYGDQVVIPMDGARAEVVKIVPGSGAGSGPIAFNVKGSPEVNGNCLTLTGVKGEVGTKADATVLLPRAVRKIDTVSVNGRSLPFHQTGRIIELTVPFAGHPFRHMQEVGNYDPTFSGGIYRASFTIPNWVFEQLKERAKSYPIPWAPADYDTPWLVPQRLLLFVQIAQPADTMNVGMKLDGKPVKLVKAYSSVRPFPRAFVGFYLDCSRLEPGRNYNVELTLPGLRRGQFQGLFFNNIITKYTTRIK